MIFHQIRSKSLIWISTFFVFLYFRMKSHAEVLFLKLSHIIHYSDLVIFYSNCLNSRSNNNYWDTFSFLLFIIHFFILFSRSLPYTFYLFIQSQCTLFILSVFFFFTFIYSGTHQNGCKGFVAANQKKLNLLSLLG